MADDNDKPIVESPWMTVFMEAAMRAIRLVHHAHQPLTLGKPGKLGQGALLDRLNVGPGIELADERVVCGQILLELATSRITSNIHFIENKAADSREGHRTFEYDRERHEKVGYVDLVFKRADEHEPLRKFGRIYMEAKRAARWTVDPLQGNVAQGHLLLKEIGRDVEKLKEIAVDPADQEAYFYVLVWGSTDDQSSPAGMLEDIRADYPDGRYAVRWLPVNWDRGSWDAPPKGVGAWLWLALLEVLPPRAPL